MSNTLAVFGATGQQGGSVVTSVLNDAELSQQYKIRAISRDTTSSKANELRKHSVEVVQADVSDRSSLEKVLTGVHTVYIMTTPSLGLDARDTEFNSGKIIADVAVEKRVQYVIFSTLPSPRDISGGKFQAVTPFDAKADIEKYIRSLKIKSAFVSPGFFFQNFQTQPFLLPKLDASSGTWILGRHTSLGTQIAWIDVVGDLGKFVGAILAGPDKYEGKTFCAAVKLYTWPEVAEILTQTTGKKVEFKQISTEEWKDSLPFLKDVFDEGFRYIEEFGEYGPDTEKLVAWAAENARGKLTTMEEFFKAHPLQLS